ncbi:MAG: limonene-1,2-epoxide hydrolase family protein [Acidimicrobiales bacterium]
MSPSETVTEFMRSIERKDVDAAVAFTSRNISYENMPTDPIVGHEGLAATLHMFLGPAGTVEWQILTQHEIGSVVVNERLDRFQIGDGWLELPVAGVFHVDDDGKIDLWRDYFDMGTYQRQFAELTGK